MLMQLQWPLPKFDLYIYGKLDWLDVAEGEPKRFYTLHADRIHCGYTIYDIQIQYIHSRVVKILATGTFIWVACTSQACNLQNIGTLLQFYAQKLFNQNYSKRKTLTPILSGPSFRPHRSHLPTTHIYRRALCMHYAPAKKSLGNIGNICPPFVFGGLLFGAVCCAWWYSAVAPLGMALCQSMAGDVLILFQTLRVQSVSPRQLKKAKHAKLMKMTFAKRAMFWWRRTARLGHECYNTFASILEA